MALIITFLGKGGVGRSTVAIAAAKQLADKGRRVLLASHDPGPALSMVVGMPLTCDPQSVLPNIDIAQFQSTVLLERSWDEVKRMEAQYLKDPFFKNVYGQELGLFPGMDQALALNALREWDASGTYDVIIYDGSGDQATLRMLGMPDILGWYLRRFRDVFLESDLVKTLTPFAQPVASAVLNVEWGGDWLQKPNEADGMLEQGKAAVNDPRRVVAYLVTTADRLAISTAQYLWGGAQQIGLTVNGVLLNQSPAEAMAQDVFKPLAPVSLPTAQLADLTADGWASLAVALPDMEQTNVGPAPVTVDVASHSVRLFLPSFDKKQVKLTQYGPEVTIEAGDQRRNVSLPQELRGRSVTGAKFQDGYLLITF